MELDSVTVQRQMVALSPDSHRWMATPASTVRRSALPSGTLPELGFNLQIELTTLGLTDQESSRAAAITPLELFIPFNDSIALASSFLPAGSLI
jgi:hypothetical protein